MLFYVFCLIFSTKKKKKNVGKKLLFLFYGNEQIFIIIFSQLFERLIKLFLDNETTLKTDQYVEEIFFINFYDFIDIKWKCSNSPFFWGGENCLILVSFLFIYFFVISPAGPVERSLALLRIYNSPPAKSTISQFS